MSPSIRDSVLTSSFLLCLWTARHFFDFFHVFPIRHWHSHQQGRTV